MLSAAAAVAAEPARGLVTARVTGEDATGANTFTGTLTLDHFRIMNGALSAVGTVDGTLTDTATRATQAVSQQVTAPVTVDQATCQILDLVLDPLDLDLLGLSVDLNQIHLTIPADQGPGNGHADSELE